MKNKPFEESKFKNKPGPGGLIAGVAAGSPAEAVGIAAGERLLLIDNRAVKDIIEYKIMEADDTLRLLLLTASGTLKRVTVRKSAETPLGLQFDPPTLAPLKRCRNRCMFCFINQNPRGLRRSLYLKDDDYRLSFLSGNYITLNSLEPAELQRIIKLRLSPLYVSVHATDPEARSRLFGSGRARQGLENLYSLVSEGIQAHLQVVLCPGYNLGEVLEKTVRDLSRLGREALSLALVPVGLTAHRPADSPLRRLDKEEAGRLVRQAARWQYFFLKTRGSRFVFLADEIYNLAGEPFPVADAYEGFPQLENGVGLARLFLDELEQQPKVPLKPISRPICATLATGREAAPLLEQLAQRFAAVAGLSLQIEVIENNFFGSPVTVAGLLTGADLEAGLFGKDLGEAVFISRSLLKDRSNLFLDGTTVDALEQRLQVPVRAVSGPEELARALKQFGTNRRRN